VSFADKLVHGAVYAILGALAWRALAASGGGRSTAGGRRTLVLAWLLTLVYGVSDEVHQRFVPGRTPDPWDVVADATGGAIGILARRSFEHRRRKT